MTDQISFYSFWSQSTNNTPSKTKYLVKFTIEWKKGSLVYTNAFIQKTRWTNFTTSSKWTKIAKCTSSYMKQKKIQQEE